MALLFEPLDGFHKFHLPLDHEKINDTDIFDEAVLLKLFSHFLTALGLIFRQIILQD